jgi:hypothetical protein
MIGREAARIESVMDAGAATLFAAAAAYTLHSLVAGSLETVGGGALAFVLCLAVLRRVEPEARHFRVGDFLVEPAAARPGELLLTEADRYIQPGQTVAADDELVLDDILAELGPESRVVRLFDPAAVPTAGQLQARIDWHLDEGAPPGASPDASQALYDALAELRRSLN